MLNLGVGVDLRGTLEVSQTRAGRRRASGHIDLVVTRRSFE